MLNGAFLVHVGLSRSDLDVMDLFGGKENNFWADASSTSVPFNGTDMPSPLFLDQVIDAFWDEYAIHSHGHTCHLANKLLSYFVHF